jgi:hypothetical protein
METELVFLFPSRKEAYRIYWMRDWVGLKAVINTCIGSNVLSRVSKWRCMVGFLFSARAEIPPSLYPGLF